VSAIKLTSLFIMSAFYLFAGISHFRKPKFFLKITPKWVPFPKQINLIIGLIEIFLSLLLLFNSTRHYAVLGIIVLLVTVFPANVYHFQLCLKSKKYIFLSFLRLPLQLVLIYWAFQYV